MPWRFWFSAVLSAFLIMTFVYYLPLRFLHQATAHEEEDLMPHGMTEENVHAMDHGAAAYHEETDVKEGLVVNLDIWPVPVRAGDPAEFHFYPSEKPGNVPLPLPELQLEHTKLMHVIGVRDDMNEFFHIHPHVETSADGANQYFFADYTFQKPGRYKLWSQITKDGVAHTFGHNPINVEGAGERSNKAVSFDRKAIVGNYQVALKTDEPFVKGREHKLSFDIHTLTGQEVGVEQYLGAQMHLAIIKDDWTEFIHTHPEEEGHMGFSVLPAASAHGVEEETGAGETDKTINFHITFPASGLYRAYAQFRPKGIALPADEALTAMFWLKVEEKAPLAVSPWWLLLLSSAALIVILGAIVKKYLNANE